MKDQSKYYYDTKSKDWFPFKKRKFNTSEHLIFKSKDKCSYKVDFLLSFQENQILEGLCNSLQCNSRDSLRISIHHLHQEGSTVDRTFQAKAKADSKEKGHTSRSNKLSLRITKDEMLKLEDIAEINYLSIKEAARLTITWMNRGIKDDSIKRIKNCKEIKPDDRANEWKANQTEFKQDQNVKDLREIRQFWHQYYEDQKKEKRDNKKKDKFYNRMIKKGVEKDPEALCDERFQEILDKEGVKEEDLDNRQMIIYDMMARLQVDYQSASLFYEDQLDEFRRVSKMSSYEFMQHVKAEKEAERAREWEEMHKERKEKAYRELVENESYKARYKSKKDAEYPFTPTEIEVIIENKIRTKEQLEADLKEHRAKLKDPLGEVEQYKEKEERYKKKEHLQSRKDFVHRHKQGLSEKPLNPDKLDDLTKNLYDTYDEWIDKHLVAMRPQWKLFESWDSWIDDYLAEP